MNHESRGFTLLEFLISLSLGLYLITFATSLYVNLQKTILFIESIDEIEANGCVALSTLTRDIRMAGFIGVPRLLDIKVDKQNHFTPADSLLGWHRGRNSVGKPLPIDLTDTDSDVLLVQYAEPNGIPIVEAHHDFIKASKKLRFHPERILLIADCLHAETLQLSNRYLQHKYQKDAMLSPLYRIVYYVAPTGRKNEHQQPISALYRRDLNAPSTRPTELVEGVEKLEIRYGVCTRSPYLTYFEANAVHNWLSVRNVTLTLHLSGLEGKNISTTAATTDSSSKDSCDKGLKRKWKQTVMLRARSAWT